jgi:hypothetical protein
MRRMTRSFNEISSLRHDHQLSGYSQEFMASVTYSKDNSHSNKEEKPLGSVYIQYVKGVSQKFKHIGNQYNIRMIFETKHTLRSWLKRTREGNPQQTSQCVSSIPCEYGRSYVGGTGRPLAVHLCEHRHSLKEDLLEKSNLAHHAYEEGHRVGWNEARILKIESNNRYRKYKESTHVACLINLISQHSLDIYPIGIPLISNEVSH